MWLKYREIAPGNAMKFIDFIANGASGVWRYSIGN